MHKKKKLILKREYLDHGNHTSSYFTISHCKKNYCKILNNRKKGTPQDCFL